MVDKLCGEVRGVYAITPTPFTEEGALDRDGIGQLVAFYAERGCNGLAILGVMGEAAKLSSSERRAVTQEFIACAQGLPVVVGVPSESIADAVEQAEQAMALGAAGLLVAPPRTARTERQIFGHFAEMARLLGPDVPISVQDFPLATGVVMETELLVRIFAEIASCVMYKAEDWSSFDKIEALRAGDGGRGRRVSIMTGLGALDLPEDLARGGDGAMSGFSFPEMLAGVVAAHSEGDREHMHDVFDAYLPLLRYELQLGKGMAVRKHILHRRGALRSAAVRRPGPSLNANDVADIELLLRRQERAVARLER
ncbi:MAG: dihydrodipicolinate synthase family protein [Rhizobiales bacterium]|nr:dihydrodipicolinate synthase family protein [Hyphomicrobiales bacterium]